MKIEDIIHGAFITVNSIYVKSTLSIQILGYRAVLDGSGARTLLQTSGTWHKTNFDLIIYCEKGEADRIASIAQNNPLINDIQSHLVTAFDDTNR